MTDIRHGYAGVGIFAGWVRCKCGQHFATRDLLAAGGFLEGLDRG